MLTLRDVVYEITPHCNKGCIECGSHGISHLSNPTKEQIDAIVNAILEYPPETITITGGEPGALPIDVLNSAIDKLSEKCRVNIVTNGAIFNVDPNSKLGVIGLSINKLDDTEVFEKLYCRINKYRTTMITNFGTHNIWSFDDLAEIAKDFGTWQIQLTMGEFMLPADGIEYLMDKISKTSDVKIVLADNLDPDRKCLAGINMCGITYDGEVVPCLSERASNHCKITTYGNIVTTGLKNIWEHGFKDMRFTDDGWCNECRKGIVYPEKKPKPAMMPQISDPHVYWEREMTTPRVYLYAVSDAVFDSQTYCIKETTECTKKF